MHIHFSAYDVDGKCVAGAKLDKRQFVQLCGRKFVRLSELVSVGQDRDLSELERSKLVELVLHICRMDLERWGQRVAHSNRLPDRSRLRTVAHYGATGYRVAIRQA